MSRSASWVERAKRPRAVWSLALALAASPLVALPAAGEEADDASGDTEGAVRISDGGLHPETLRVRPGQTISWLNEEEQIAVLSFPGDLAEPLSCGTDDLRPEFYRDGSGRVVSTPIGPLPFALPCPLPSGTWAYRVHLHRRQGPPGAPIAPPSPVEHPNASYDGTLVIE